MAEQCALYISRREAVTRDEVREQAAGATLDRLAPALDGGREQLRLAWPDVQILLAQQDRDEPHFARHLHGICAHVDRLADGLKGASWQLYERLTRTQHVIGITIHPDYDRAGIARRMILGLARQVNGVLFRDGGFYDGQDRLLLGPRGTAQSDAALPEFAAAVFRKQRTEQRLRERGLAEVPDLPTIVSDDEAVLREPIAVARRAVALWAVTGRAMGTLEPDELVPYLKEQQVWSALTRREQALLLDARPNQQTLIDATWRAEALAVLFWALGQYGIVDLPFPEEPCDVAALAAQFAEQSLSEFLSQATLLPLDRILDAADQAYRLHRIAHDAVLAGVESPLGIPPGVVFQQHYTLRWLTRYLDQDWDDITTDE